MSGHPSTTRHFQHSVTIRFPAVSFRRTLYVSPSRLFDRRAAAPPACLPARPRCALRATFVGAARRGARAAGFAPAGAGPVLAAAGFAALDAAFAGGACGARLVRAFLAGVCTGSGSSCSSGAAAASAGGAGAPSASSSSSSSSSAAGCAAARLPRRSLP